MENFFLGFLNRSIAAGWLILAVMALRMLLKRSPKWIHCLLWALVAFRLACPFSLESVFSLIPSRETVRHDMTVSSGPVVDSGVRFVDNAVNRAIRESAAPRPEKNVDPLQTWLFVASVIWIVGVVAMLLYALVAYVRLLSKIRTAVRLEGPVMLSEFVETPFLSGIARPRIYLPSDMPEGMREPVIAHELAHLKRHDNLWKILGYALLAAYWFHPLSWAAYILLCRDIERACDEKVIRGYDMHQRKLYSEALLACSMDRRAGLACPLAFGEISVKERIKSVLNYKRPAFWAIVAAVAACVVAAVCFLTDPVKEEEGTGGAALAGADGGNGAGSGVGGNVDAGGAASGAEASDGGDGTGISGTGGSGEDGSSDREGSGNGAEASGTDNDNGSSSGGTADGNGAANGGASGNGSGTGLADGSEDSAEAAAQAALREELVRQWSEAFVDRDGNAIESLASPSLAGELLAGPEGNREFGVSSPWPRETDRDIYIRNIGEQSAQIQYYAWTSDPHVAVWTEDISYELRDGNYIVTAENLTYLDDISTSAEFGEAYGYCPINGSAMDYESNGTGEDLNASALLSSSMRFRGLFQPESAAVELLNLSEDSSKVQIERVYEESGSVNLYIHFPEEEDGLPMPVTMVQPYGPEGIWIPKDYTVDVMARFRNMDWNEIRKKRLAVTNDPGIWREVVCIAEIPEESIKIYGYNDAEWSFEGVAIEFGDDVNYFDWIYTSPQCRLPECYWNQAARQLQVALNVYTGTGVFAQKLHVLQHHDTGTLTDNALEMDEYLDMLEERIHYRFEEETGQLTLFDTGNQRELASVTVEEDMVTGLELGSISRFLLGETIWLSVEPGYFVEGGAIAEYPEDMPMLEAELVFGDNGGEITFSLGEIRVAD